MFTEREIFSEDNIHLKRIDDYLKKLKENGIKSSPIISSGAAVFLYELGYNERSERIPTDLDLILPLDDLKRMTDVSASLGLEIRSQPRHTRWGMQYHNLLLEGDGDFPLDLMGVLNTLFPDNHPFLPGELYTFPDPYNYPFLSREIEIEGKRYTLASPGHVLFYKATQMRNGLSDNGTVKQDIDDIRRILSLGIVSPEELNQELYYLTYGDDNLRRTIINWLNNNFGQRIEYLEIPSTKLSFEEQIEGLRNLSVVINEIFGEGNWCYSNGTALAIHSYERGRQREITDIDIFYYGGDIFRTFPLNFFDTPFGRVKYQSNPFKAHGISYRAPQLKGRIFLGEAGRYEPFNVDIISRSEMEKDDGNAMVIGPDEVSKNLESIDGIPVMGLELIREVKNFSRRDFPKTDIQDLDLINSLRR